MDDAELLRYSRHILLPQLGIEGQARLQQAHVLLIGVGGLGSPVALYLAASGVGTLTLVDDDRVDLSNLQRQIAHTSERIGTWKVDSAAVATRALNPAVTVHAIRQRLDAAALQQAVNAADVVVDATDNFAARFAINAACVAARKPLVSGAAIRLEGQVTVFDLRQRESACYRCLYAEQDELAETCSQTGVLAPAVGVIGCIQAVETLKLLAGFGDTLAGRLLLFDAASMEWRSLRLRRDPQCPVCAQNSN